jgi:GrpB protein
VSAFKSKFSSVSRVSRCEVVGEPFRLGAVILRYGSSVAPMRLPPLPSPPKPLTPEQMTRRVVGDRPAEVTAPITVSPYDPEWPAMYAREAARIRSALGARVLAVDHVGSTAVPGLPAKDRIDIDLIVADPAAEDAYVPALAVTAREEHRNKNWR